MAKKRKALPEIPQPADLIDLLEKRVLAYHDDSVPADSVSYAWEAIRNAVAVGDWGRALIGAFDLGVWHAGVEASPIVLQSMQTEIELVPIANKELTRKSGKEKSDQKRKSTAESNADKAKELLQWVPDDVRMKGAIAIHGRIAKQLGVKLRTVQGYLRGIDVCNG